MDGAFSGVQVPGGRLSGFLCLVVRECRRKGLCSWIDFFFLARKGGILGMVGDWSGGLL